MKTDFDINTFFLTKNRYGTKPVPDPPKRNHNIKTFYALIKNDHIYIH